MKPDSLLKPDSAIFSIYCTQDTIQLRIGCQECDQARLISAHNSYEKAHAFGQILVEKMGLPFKDFAGDR